MLNCSFELTTVNKVLLSNVELQINHLKCTVVCLPRQEGKDNYD